MDGKTYSHAECSLKLMNKVTNRGKDFLQPLAIEQYGRNIITNIEDTSPRGQKLAKY